jgi:predicted  nucleic acid-binding Zn-ribbon protein
MKATEAAQQDLLALGAIDIEIGRTKRAVAKLVSGEQHDEIRSRVREVAGRLIQARNQLDDASLELERAEADLKVVDARIVKDNAALKSTSIPSVATGIQHELATLARRKSELEDIEIAILEKRELLEASFAEITAEKAAVDAELSQAQSASEQEIIKLKSGLSLQGLDRDQLVARIPADLLEAYERKAGRGSGVGRLVGRECSACHIGIDAVAYAAITALAKDELAECPECSAFLVRS